MSINYRDEMELGVPDDDPELIAEIHACYAQINELQARIKELESRPNLKVETGDLYKLTKVINDQKAALDAANENNKLLTDQVSHWFGQFEAEKTGAHQRDKERDAEVEALKIALQWYTDRKNLDQYIGTSEHHTATDHWFNCWMMMPVTTVARKALGMKTETEEILNGRSNNKRGV